MKLAKLIGLSLAVLALGCTDATSLMVEVTSDDLAVPADVDALQFEVESDTGRSLNRTYRISGAWPHSLAVLPASSNDASATVTVTGLKGGSPVVRRIVGAQFVPGMQRRIEVRLDRACLGLPCAEGVDCVAGTCVGTSDPDGGVEMDGGVDAGPSDAGRPDPDGGFDGGTDGGLDGGMETDGGHDSGTPELDGGHSPPMTLLFTEYVEGTSNNKAVEIMNGTGASYDLSRCAIDRYSNGSHSATAIELSGTVPPGGFFVVCHNLIEDDSRCDLTSGALNHNGNDVLVLVCDGATVDSFGQIGFSGTAWVEPREGGISSVDHVLTRKCAVSSGDTDPSDAFVVEADWQGAPFTTAAALTSLGNRTECP